MTQEPRPLTGGWTVADEFKGPGLLRRRRRLIALSAVVAMVVLFYGAFGYLASADMFGDHPRWRGMNRAPADFGLHSETVSFSSEDGIPLQAWWLAPTGTSRATVIVAHGIDHTRQVMLPRAVFLVRAGYSVLINRPPRPW